jgi:hypothetical protein
MDGTLTLESGRSTAELSVTEYYLGWSGHAKALKRRCLFGDRLRFAQMIRTGNYWQRIGGKQPPRSNRAIRRGSFELLNESRSRAADDKIDRRGDFVC